MADEQKPKFGGINQYATVGKKRAEKQETERLDEQDVKRVDVQITEDSNVQVSNGSNVETSKGVDVEETKGNGKRERNRQTVYLEPDLDDWVRQYIVTERRKRKRRVEISDIVNEALRLFQESVTDA